MNRRSPSAGHRPLIQAAVASLPAMLALVTLALKAWVEWQAKRPAASQEAIVRK